MVTNPKEEPESKKPREQSAGELVANIVDSIREIGVDFFGSMVPGILFVVGAFFIVGIPFFYLWVTLAPNIGSIILNSAEVVTRDSRLFIFGAVLSIIFYVIGFLFYRRDPKNPDKKSWKFITDKMTRQEKSNWVARDEDECQYPYDNLRQYYIH